MNRTLLDWALPQLVDTACLLVSELVTNSVLHAATSMELTLSLTDGELRIDVADRSAQPARRRSLDLEASTGRGLILVESLSQEWGVEPVDRGKRVWFTMSTP